MIKGGFRGTPLMYLDIHFSILILIGYTFIWAQSPDTLWTARYNGPADDWDRAFGCAIDNFGNLYVTGYSYSGGISDYLTIKYNSVTGETLWTARYNGPQNLHDGAFGCAVDDSGGLYVTGYSYDIALCDYLTIKYNSVTGETLWTARYNGLANSEDMALGCIVDNSGNLYVTGYSFYSGTGFDYLTIKYNSVTGETLWTARYNGPANLNDIPRSCALDNSGSLYVAGYCEDIAGYDYLTIKYNSVTGETLWTARYNGPTDDDDYACDCAVDGSGNLYVTGLSFNGANYDYLTIKYNSVTGETLWTARYNGPANLHDGAIGCAVDDSGGLYVTGYSSYSGTEVDYLTIKYNSVTGETLWTVRYNGPTDGADFARGCAVNSSGNLYVTGSSFNGANYDYLTIKYNSVTGETLWTVRYNGPTDDDDYACDCAVDSSGNLYVTGSSFNGANYDYLTIKYGTIPGVKEFHFQLQNSALRLFSNYNNPCRSNVELRYQITANKSYVTLKIYNLVGQLVKTLIANEPKSPGSYSVRWNGRDENGRELKSGVYFCELRIDKQSLTKKIVLLQ